jgi:putative transposase
LRHRFSSAALFFTAGFRPALAASRPGPGDINGALKRSLARHRSGRVRFLDRRGADQTPTEIGNVGGHNKEAFDSTVPVELSNVGLGFLRVREEAPLERTGTDLAIAFTYEEAILGVIDRDYLELEFARPDDWAKIAPLLPGKVGDRGRSAADNRLFVEAVLWIARTGSPWRDLPPEFGRWNSVYVRFRRWARAGVWERLRTLLQADLDREYLMLDSTVVRAHQHAAGAKGALPPKGSAAPAAD